MSRRPCICLGPKSFVENTFSSLDFNEQFYLIIALLTNKLNISYRVKLKTLSDLPKSLNTVFDIDAHRS